jgi:mannose-6-phosphate isomerase-like protein (cupin superfamily)
MTDANSAAIQTEPIAAAYIQLSCTVLRPMLDFFLDRLKFRVEAIFPADDPQTALISGYGLNLYLVTTTEKPAQNILRLLCTDPLQVAQGQTQLEAPDGLLIKLVHADPPMLLLPTRQELVISRNEDNAHWSVGRADLRYRDLLPQRHGGAFIASHIRVLAGGPVPDYVHYHKVRFQMIFCRKGWVRVVYEGQGEPFVLEAGDCVLQPPKIRHRVLESSAGAEVVEIASPAQHITMADNEMALPSARLPADYDFGGQKFVLHQASQAVWQPWRLPGFMATDTGIARATQGLATARVVQAEGPDPTVQRSKLTQSHQSEFCFYFVLSGQLELDMGHQKIVLQPDDSVTLPGQMSYALSAQISTQFLEVMLPAEPMYAYLD